MTSIKQGHAHMLMPSSSEDECVTGLHTLGLEKIVLTIFGSATWLDRRQATYLLAANYHQALLYLQRTTAWGKPSKTLQQPWQCVTVT